MRWVVVLCAVAGCSRVTTTSGDDTSSSTITLMVAKRPAVHDVVSLVFTITNDGSTTSETAQLTDTSFPLNYEADAPGMSGSLDIKVEAFDAGGLLVGRGTTTAELGVDGAAVMLQGVDFTLNSGYAGNQFLTNDFETVGLQLATESSDTWMVTFRDECTSCNMLARRFDAAGRPMFNNFTINSDQFPINASPSTTAAIPTLVKGFDGLVAFWDFTAVSGGAQGIACRAIDFGTQTAVTTEAADVVTAAAGDLGDRIFVTWQAFLGTQVVRTMMLSADCGAFTAPVTLSQTSGSTGARRSHVAVAGTVVVYTWIVDGELHARFGTDDGSLNPTEMTLLTKTATQEIDFVRVVPYGGWFALAVRWVSSSGTGPGKIELYMLTETGALFSPLLVTDQSGSDFASAKAFGLASRSDGLLMVVWHACPTGPGSCDVFGRFARSTPELVGEAFVVPTNSAADQVNPSVTALGDSFIVAWTDSSGTEPDTSGTAVRARILVPDL